MFSMTKDKSILIKNIYYMLSYAFAVLRQKEYENIATEKFENIHDLFAAILSKGIGRQIKQGLYREYVNYNEDEASLKGKINMQGSIRNKLLKKRLIACEYDELSENNLLNQILKTTVMRLLKCSEVKTEYKNDLKKEMMFFAGVDRIVNLTAIPWATIRFQKSNDTYRMLIGVCKLILEGMLLTTESGEYRLFAFEDGQGIAHLYEKFILEYYKKECPQVKASAAQIPWALDDGFKEKLPVMQSDITLEKGDTVLIIDAKFYTHTMQSRYDASTFHSNNLYQIFTYVKNKDYGFGNKPHTVSGMLLYAATDEETQPNSTYSMSGNKIAVKTLDLNRNFIDIKAQLNAVADEYFGR